MSAQVRTPTRNQYDPPPGYSTPSNSKSSIETEASTSQTRSSQKEKRLRSCTEQSSLSAKRKKSNSKYQHNFFKGGVNVTDPLNLIGIENRTVATPQPSPRPEDVVMWSGPVSVTDPLHLSVDEDDDVGPISPTLVPRKRKRLTKKVLQKLEIDFDSDTDQPPDKKPNTEITSPPATTTHQTIPATPQSTAATTTSTSTGSSALASSERTTSHTSSHLPHEPSASHDTHTPISVKVPEGSQSASKMCKSHKSPHKSTKSPKSTGHHQSSSQHRQLHRRAAESKQSGQRTDGGGGKRKRQFTHGNYNQYYGYRSTERMETDPRISALRPAWLRDKRVLDIGCNIGHVTTTIARDYHPSSVVGLDIDCNLINVAKKNIRHYHPVHSDQLFPTSFTDTYGGAGCPSLSDGDAVFPNNVSFITANYCLKTDAELEMVKPEFDAILALSITKWIHLNNGDAGLKRCFHRMFRQLTPGGVLVLEPQMWPSYKKRKNLTELIRKNFDAITLRPDQFNEFLLSEVGFSTCEKLSVQQHQSKGFRRPLFVFKKSDDT